MLGLFRRFTNSKAGAIVAFLVLGLIAFAFAAGDVTGLAGGSGEGMTVQTAADVGDERVPESDLVTQSRNALRAIQQQQPTADMAGLIASGGVESVLEQLIDQRAAAAFARAQGMTVTDRAVDGVIAGIPAFRGVDGRFSQAAFDAALAQQRVTERQVRDDIASERLIQYLTAPANGAARAGTQFATPYASLLLERRRGAVAVIPAAAVPAGPAPTDAEVAAFYRANLRRYTVPERRVIRYALVTPASVLPASAPTDADLQAAYRQDPARFAATERRTAQVATVLDRGAADRIAAAVRGGTALDAAARAAGLEVRTLTKLDRAAVTAQTSAAFAQALFAAAPDAVVGPVRGAGGTFTVGRVTAVDRVPAKSFAAARAELLPEVTKANQAKRLVAINDALDTAAGEGATFDEMVAAQKLTAERSPAVMQNGRDPLNIRATPNPALAPVVQGGFTAEQGDAPQIVPLGTDGGFALVSLESVIAAAPRPLAQIRGDVAAAVQQRRALVAARAVAAGVVAKVDRGTPLAAALAQTGLKLPGITPANVPRAALAADPRGADPALALMFAMPARRAKLLELPGRGWAVVYLESITPGDAAKDARTVTAARSDLNRVLGREMVEQFGRAMRDQLGVKRNPAAIARAKAELSGRSPDAQP